MKVIVFLELAADVRIPPELDARSGRIREEWLVREIDPASARALDLALGLKAAAPATEVTVIHLGPPDAEPWLRQALARGCDRAVRVWGEEAAGVGAPGKAVILAAAAEAGGFDLILAGASGVMSSSGQFGVLLAENLRVPCVTQAIEFGPLGGRGRLEIARSLDQGYRERVEAPLPLVVTVSAGGPSSDARAPTDVAVTALLAAYEQEIVLWDLADLGVPRDKVLRADRALRSSRPRPRRPRLHRLEAPDPALPAFDRILELVRGSVRAREGRVVRKPAEAIVAEIFATLKNEGWLDHLKAPRNVKADDGGGLRGPGVGKIPPSDDGTVGGPPTPEAGERL